MSDFNSPLPAAPLDRLAEGIDPAAPQPDALLDRVVDGAHDAIDQLALQAAPHVQRLQDGLADANEMLHQRSDKAREIGADWSESFSDTVRSHPIGAVVVAVIAGLVIARLTA